MGIKILSTDGLPTVTVLAPGANHVVLGNACALLNVPFRRDVIERAAQDSLANQDQQP